jgi:hypothetical protein
MHTHTHTVGHKLIQEALWHVVIWKRLPHIEGHLPFDGGTFWWWWWWWRRRPIFVLLLWYMCVEGMGA